MAWDLYHYEASYVLSINNVPTWAWRDMWRNVHVRECGDSAPMACSVQHRRSEVSPTGDHRDAVQS